VPSSSAFVEFALELLSGVGPVRARAMFGGHGLYLGDAMVGLLDGDELFLRADDATRPAFVAAGCRQWFYEGRGRRVEMPYFRPPDEAHESPEAMLPWAERAAAAARRALAGKRAAAAKKGKRRRSR
jgi:DNA transformation protein